MIGRARRDLIELVGVVMIVLLAAWPASARADEAEDPKRAAAREHFKAGLAFMEDPAGQQFEQAHRQFKKAYDLSGSVNALQNLAVCAYKLERYGEAISYYQTFLPKQDKLSQADRTRFEKDLLTMKQSVAYVVLTSKRKPGSVIDTRSATQGSVTNVYKLRDKPLRLGVHPGQHSFVVTAEKGGEDSWKIAIDEGQTLKHHFGFEAPARDEGLGTGVWVSGGVGVAAVVAGVALVIVGAGKSSAADDKFAEHQAAKGKKNSPPAHFLAELKQAAEDLEQAATTLTTAGAVVLGVGGAAVGAAVVMALMSGDDGGDEEVASGHRFGRSWGMGPRFDAAHAGAVFWGRF
jgi:tetratricopeptide (TPR) repeat protein